MSIPGTHFLDTSALVALMKRGSVAEPGSLVSLTALAELATGVALNPNPEREKARIGRVIGAAEIVLPTLATATIYGQITAQLRRAGKVIPTNDIWIAALAIERGLPLCAEDGHFAHVDGLKLYPCATPRESLRIVFQNNSQTSLVVRRLEEEPTISRVRSVLRRRIMKAATEEGARLTDDNIRLASLAGGSGSAFYCLWIEDSPAALCLACWDATQSQRVWRSAEGGFFNLAERIRRSANLNIDIGYQGQDAPAPPWFSCVLVPPTGNIVPAASADSAFNRLLPCTMWALMDLERETAGPDRN